jgi:hypothetical protein
VTKTALYLLASALSLLTLPGCGTFYTGRQGRKVIEADPEGRYTLGIVELDDQGWFFDRRDVADVLNEAKAAVDGNGATIVVYVHGWHHNAGSGNLDEFRKTLVRVHEQLNEYAPIRSFLLPGAQSRVVGIYVGWRGRALPGRLPITFWTFWNRRAAALRVGHGDAPELLSRIQSIYEKGNEQPKDKSATKIAGLVIVGHSFGGQVVYGAVSDILKQRIGAEIEVDEMDATGRVPNVIRGFGDLVILVNPAVEASVYQSISGMVRDKEFQPQQSPIMLVLSSEGDWPNRWPFSFGRRLGVGQEPRGRAGQYEMKTHSIGNVASQVTHCLRLEKDQPCSGFHSQVMPDEAPTVELSQSRALALLTQNPKALCKVGTLALAGEVQMKDEELRLEPVRARYDRHLPFLVARTKPSIVSGHSDVFSENLREFVVRYAALVQTKRLSAAFASRCVDTPP